MDYLKRMELPPSGKFTTPGWALALDEKIGQFGRMVVVYVIELVFLLVFCIIGAGIKSGVKSLGTIYTIADIVRFSGTGSGGLACACGAFGTRIRSPKLLFFSVVLNFLAIILDFGAAVIDTADIFDATKRIKTSLSSGKDPGKLYHTKSQALISAILGAVAVLFIILGFYITYAFYQEETGFSGGSVSKSSSPRNDVPQSDIRMSPQMQSPAYNNDNYGDQPKVPGRRAPPPGGQQDYSQPPTTDYNNYSDPPPDSYGGYPGGQPRNAPPPRGRGYPMVPSSNDDYNEPQSSRRPLPQTGRSQPQPGRSQPQSSVPGKTSRSPPPPRGRGYPTVPSTNDDYNTSVSPQSSRRALPQPGRAPTPGRRGPPPGARGVMM